MIFVHLSKCSTYLYVSWLQACLSAGWKHEEQEGRMPCKGGWIRPISGHIQIGCMATPAFKSRYCSSTVHACSASDTLSTDETQHDPSAPSPHLATQQAVIEMLLEKFTRSTYYKVRLHTDTCKCILTTRIKNISKKCTKMCWVLSHDCYRQRKTEFCEMKASIFVLHITLSVNTANNQRAQKQV